MKDFDRINKDLPDSKKIVLRKLAYDLRLILNPAPLPRTAAAEVELPSSLIPLAPVPQCVFLSFIVPLFSSLALFLADTLQPLQPRFLLPTPQVW